MYHMLFTYISGSTVMLQKLREYFLCAKKTKNNDFIQ